MLAAEPPVGGQANSDERVWALTNEWMSKIEKAYSEYLSVASRVTWITLGMGFLTLIILIGLFSSSIILDSIRRHVSNENFFGTEAGAVVIILLVLAILATVLFYGIRRIRQLHLLRRELSDVLTIAEELFQMVTSLEENRARVNNTGSRYEYLVNHVRILEIKHLLAKVERVVRRVP
jgi:hypothetical protein